MTVDIVEEGLARASFEERIAFGTANGPSICLGTQWEEDKEPKLYVVADITRIQQTKNLDKYSGGVRHERSYDSVSELEEDYSTLVDDHDLDDQTQYL